MPNIKPVSDLKNYTAIVNQISYGNRSILQKTVRNVCADRHERIG